MTRPPYCRCKMRHKSLMWHWMSNSRTLARDVRTLVRPSKPVCPLSLFSANRMSRLRSQQALGSDCELWCAALRNSGFRVSLCLTSVPVSTVLWFSDAGQDWWWFAPHHKHRTHSDWGGWQAHSSFGCAAPVPLQHSTSDWHRAFCLTYFNLGSG